MAEALHGFPRPARLIHRFWIIAVEHQHHPLERILARQGRAIDQKQNIRMVGERVAGGQEDGWCSASPSSSRPCGRKLSSR